MSSSTVSATAIPSNRSKSFSTPGHSPQLMTPTSTPPTSGHHHQQHHHHHGPPCFAEQRLQQLLMNCAGGTQAFHRSEAEDHGRSHTGNVPGPSGSGSGVSDARRKSFAAGEGQKANRRPSFLSSLSLSRPFGGGFTPSQPGSPSMNPQRPTGLAMTSSSSPVSISNSPVQESEIHRAKSTPPHPLDPSHLPPLQTNQLLDGSDDMASGGAGMQMQRSKTAPSTPVKVAGFRTGEFNMTASAVIPPLEKRHFDPGREPKLLGLL